MANLNVPSVHSPRGNFFPAIDRATVVQMGGIWLLTFTVIISTVALSVLMCKIRSRRAEASRSAPPPRPLLAPRVTHVPARGASIMSSDGHFSVPLPRAPHRPLVILITAAAGFAAQDIGDVDGQDGHMPAPQRVHEFVKHMQETWNVTPFIFSSDPVHADPKPGDARRFREYPPNVYIIPLETELFMPCILPILERWNATLAYVQPFCLAPIPITSGCDHFGYQYSGCDNLTVLFFRELGHKHFDPFSVVAQNPHSSDTWEASYDPFNNRYSRPCYMFDGPLPASMPSADFHRFYHDAYQELDKLRIALRGEPSAASSSSSALPPFLRHHMSPALRPTQEEFDEIIKTYTAYVAAHLPDHLEPLKSLRYDCPGDIPKVTALIAAHKAFGATKYPRLAVGGGYSFGRLSLNG